MSERYIHLYNIEPIFGFSKISNQITLGELRVLMQKLILKRILIIDTQTFSMIIRRGHGRRYIGNNFVGSF